MPHHIVSGVHCAPPGQDVIVDLVVFLDFPAGFWAASVCILLRRFARRADVLAVDLRSGLRPRRTPGSHPHEPIRSRLQ